MITKGLLTNTIISKGYGISYTIITEIGAACIKFTKNTINLVFSTLLKNTNFNRG